MKTMRENKRKMDWNKIEIKTVVENERTMKRIKEQWKGIKDKYKKWKKNKRTIKEKNI